MPPEQDRKKLLIVDDDPQLRRLLADQLETYKLFATEQAEDGTEAIEKLSGMHYDLLLLDIKMPNTSGIDVLKFIREKNLPCKVVILTGLGGIPIAMECMKLGAVDYITKPYKINYLLGSITRALGVEG